jgi:hypothetical protein
MRHEESELIEALEPILREAVDRRFRPGFSERVMERIRTDAIPVIPLTMAMKGQFLKLAPLGAAILIALGAYNLSSSGSSSDQSPFEAALGLEPVTLETAYVFEQAFYATSGE